MNAVRLLRAVPMNTPVRGSAPLVPEQGPGVPPPEQIARPRRTFSEAAAAAALVPLTEGRPYLPWGAGTMRVGGIVAVCNEIVLGSRRRVVELGSGTSTVLIARLLAQHWPDGGYRHVAVEHDAGWRQWVTGQLAREGLADRTAVVHAPLSSHDLAADGLLWYDRAALDAGLGEDRIDLLVVDGPPADTSDKGLARYPALPALAARLSAGATVVLDDIERPGEQEVVRRWTQQLGLRFSAPDVHAGVAVGRTAGPDRDAPGGCAAAR